MLIRLSLSSDRRLRPGGLHDGHGGRGETRDVVGQLDAVIAAVSLVELPVHAGQVVSGDERVALVDEVGPGLSSMTRLVS